MAAVVAVTGAEMGLIQALGASGHELVIVAACGLSSLFLSSFQRVPLESQTTYARAFRDRTRVAIKDIECDTAFGPYRPLARKLRFRSVQSTPVMARGGEVLGVLSTHYRWAEELTPHAQQVYDLYARLAATYVQVARLAARHRYKFGGRDLAGFDGAIQATRVTLNKRPANRITPSYVARACQHLEQLVSRLQTALGTV